jgi:DNA-binding GntR family transcriptional regulator
LDLAAKGFVSLIPRKGIKINALTEKDVRDLYEIRIALETPVIRCITPNLTEEAIKKTGTIHKGEKDIIKAEGRLSCFQMDIVEKLRKGDPKREKASVGITRSNHCEKCSAMLKA